MRKPTWDIDLMKFVASRAKTPFRWGVHDCTLFAADCAQVMTGVDPASKFRGGYSDQAGADAIIKEAGSLQQLVTDNIGAPISSRLARRGDWVLIRQDSAQALGVCLGTMAAAAGKDGLIYRPMTGAFAAWRIE